MARVPGKLTLAEDDRRVLVTWAVECAERTLPLFEQAAPGDARPRQALEGARSFARGQLGVGAVRRLAAQAHAAARAVDSAAATSAARACGHAAAVAHMAAHAVGAPAYAALALGCEADQASADAYVDWAVSRASAEVRRCLRKLPPRRRGRSGLAKVVHEIHAKLTA